MTDSASAPSTARGGPDVAELSRQTRDLDEARVIGGAVYYGHDVSIRGRPDDFGWKLDAIRCGPVTVGRLTYGTEVRLETYEPLTAYQISVPVAGRLATASGREQIIAEPGRAAIHLPDRVSVLHGWKRPSPVLAIKVSRRGLEAALEQLLGRAVGEGIRFDLRLDLRSGPGRQWWSMVRMLGTAIGDEPALVRRPAVAAPLAHSLMTGLLLTAGHQFRDQLEASRPAAGSAAVRRAVAFIEANADRPLTVGAIAQAAGVGVRALQKGFLDAFDTSPMRYLCDLRLRRAHERLREADPAHTTVADIATGLGFGHLGRFASQYRQVYGESPSATLRRGA